MYIRRKVFSSFIDENGEEKLFSTTEFINEYSELGEKTFAFKDYEGLSEAQKEVLKSKRSAYAKELKKNHRSTQEGISKVTTPGNGETSLESKGSITGGGVKSTYEVTTNRGFGEAKGDYVSRHRKSVINQKLKNSKDAANIMRNEVVGMGEVEAFNAARKINPNFGKTGGEALKSTPKKVIETENPIKSGARKVVKKSSLLGKKGKIALGVGAGIAAAGTGAYLYKKSKKKK